MEADVSDPALVDPVPEPDTPEPIPEPVAQAPEPEPKTEPAPVPEPARKDHWALKRISEESEKARQASERAAAAEARAQAAEAKALALQAIKDGAQPPPAPVPAKDTPDFKTSVQQAAYDLRMNDIRNDIIREGYATFGKAKFDETANILAAVNATSNDFIDDVVTFDRANAHKILSDIASDPETAVRLASMNSRQRITEISRMVAAKSAAVAEAPKAPANPLAPKKVSSAPAPAPKVTPSATPQAKDGYSDAASDDEFDAQFNKRWLERKARR